MRIRLSLVLEETRRGRASSIDDPGERRDTDTLVERAEPHPIGFTAPPPLHPDEDGAR